MQMYVDASGISEATDAAQAPILSPWVTKEALPYCLPMENRVHTLL